MTILEQLRQPFHPDDIEWRVGRAGSGGRGPWAMVLAYITSRAVMDRLDEVFGIGGWQTKYEYSPDHGVCCYLSCKIGDEWITKADAADMTDIEAIKGGHSGALKRAAVHFGIGRYLYNLKDNWAVVTPDGKYKQPKDRNGKYEAFKWNPPALPDWALPDGMKVNKEQPKPKAPAAPPPGKPAGPAKPKNYEEIEDEVESMDDEGIDHLVVPFGGEDLKKKTIGVLPSEVMEPLVKSFKDKGTTNPENYRVLLAMQRIVERTPE